MSVSLQTVQTDFQDYILHGNKEQPAIVGLISDDFGLPAAERLALYYDAYRLRLCEALSESFKKTRTYVGDDTFSELCLGYIDRHPSRNRNLRWFGDVFAAFVGAALPDYPVVAELAAFEWALGLAFDAANAPVLTAREVQGLGADDWEQVGFGVPPSLQALNLHWNAPGIWLALDQEASPPQAELFEQGRTWVIWRKDLQAHFRSVDAYEALALRGLAQGKSFAAVCAEAAALAEADITPHIAGWLQTWLKEAMLSRMALT